MTGRRAPITISPLGVLRLLLGIAGVLLLGHAFATIAEFGFGRDHVLGLRRLLDFNGEGNAPAWFSSVLFLLGGTLLSIVWHVKRTERDRFHRHWGALALVFVFLAFDEAAEVHEQLIQPVHAALDTGGALLHAWVIPYGLALLLLVAVSLPFLRSLPARTLRLMVLAGAIFVAGAVGMEMVGGYVWERNPIRGIPIIAIMALEETLEMVGLSCFAYAVLDYLARECPRLGLEVSETAS